MPPLDWRIRTAKNPMETTCSLLFGVRLDPGDKNGDLPVVYSDHHVFVYEESESKERRLTLPHLRLLYRSLIHFTSRFHSLCSPIRLMPAP